MKREKPEVPEIKMTYGQLNKGTVYNILNKMLNAQVSAPTASRFRYVTKALTQALDEMKTYYRNQIQKPYYVKFEELTGIDITKINGGGDKDLAERELAEKIAALSPEVAAKQAELDRELGAKQKEFDAIETSLYVLPLGPQHLNEIKVSANDIDALGPLYDEEGTVRQGHFAKQMGVVPPSAS